jgi:hypothetical protein
VLGIFGYVAGFGAFACFIIVLIKQFESAGVTHGVIGIITCGIWTFIGAGLTREKKTSKPDVDLDRVGYGEWRFHLFPGSVPI